MKRLNGRPLAALLAVLLMLSAFLSACSQEEAADGQEAAPAGTKKLLLLKKEGSGDPVLISHLEKLGYLVMDMSENEFTAQAAKDYAVIYVSDSVNASRLDGGLKNASAGIVYAKAQLAETAGLAGPLSYGHQQGTAVQIKDAKHPLAAGLSGEPAVYKAAGSMGYAAPGGSCRYSCGSRR